LHGARRPGRPRFGTPGSGPRVDTWTELNGLSCRLGEGIGGRIASLIGGTIAILGTTRRLQAWPSGFWAESSYGPQLTDWARNRQSDVAFPSPRRFFRGIQAIRWFCNVKGSRVHRIGLVNASAKKKTKARRVRGDFACIAGAGRLAKRAEAAAWAGLIGGRDGWTRARIDQLQLMGGEGAIPRCEACYGVGGLLPVPAGPQKG